MCYEKSTKLGKKIRHTKAESLMIRSFCRVYGSSCLFRCFKINRSGCVDLLISTGRPSDARLGTIHNIDSRLGVVFKGRQDLNWRLFCHNSCGLLTQLFILQCFELLFQILSTDDSLVRCFNNVFIDTGATNSIDGLVVSFDATLRDLKLSLLCCINGGFMVWAFRHQLSYSFGLSVVRTVNLCHSWFFHCLTKSVYIMPTFLKISHQVWAFRFVQDYILAGTLLSLLWNYEAATINRSCRLHVRNFLDVCVAEVWW